MTSELGSISIPCSRYNFKQRIELCLKILLGKVLHVYGTFTKQDIIFNNTIRIHVHDQYLNYDDFVLTDVDYIKVEVK